jgi:hypothetical protein
MAKETVRVTSTGPLRKRHCSVQSSDSVLTLCFLISYFSYNFVLQVHLISLLFLRTVPRITFAFLFKAKTTRPIKLKSKQHNAMEFN